MVAGENSFVLIRNFELRGSRFCAEVMRYGERVIRSFREGHVGKLT